MVDLVAGLKQHGERPDCRQTEDERYAAIAGTPVDIIAAAVFELYDQIRNCLF